ncbi:UNVERIFIED_CONTAM: hypothetical protein GTU68_064458 [Idotea baltica]|nr:hypothetical protein [Idotea baltica]
MQNEFREGAHVLIIGGGYIGLEAAAVSRKLGLEVTLVEAAERILQRVACPETSDAIRALHTDKGVQILEAVGIDSLHGEERVTSASLSNGETLTVDFVIAGIGAIPNQQLAEAAGLDCTNGIVVDAHGRTSDPAVWAAGDCANLEFRGTRLRLESVQNAIDQAENIAANITGQITPYDPKPWFWSDQYDAKLQIAGLNLGYDSITVRPGDKGNDVSHWYFKGDTLLAVDAINEPRAYMVGKRLIDAGRSADPARIMDTETPLKALLSN